MLSRVKILDTGYNEKYHIVFWKVQKIDSGEEISLALRANELVQNLLNSSKVTVTAEQILKFNEMMQGKEFNWDSSQIKSKNTKDYKDMTEDDLKGLQADLNTVPLPEVSAILYEQDQE